MTRIIAGMTVRAYEMMSPALSGTKPASCGIQNPNLGRAQGAGVITGHHRGTPVGSSVQARSNGGGMWQADYGGMRESKLSWLNRLW
jgi:hypothetical protein